MGCALQLSYIFFGMTAFGVFGLFFFSYFFIHSSFFFFFFEKIIINM